jgi:aryl-alcohol dehydrogenase-like predicted oxidoreductase
MRANRVLTRRDALRLLAGAGFAASCGAAGVASDVPTMQSPLIRRRIAATGEELPVIGLGTWQTFDAGSTQTERAPLADVLKLFAGSGARVVDSSPMYGRAETVVGDLARELGVRDSLFVATKVWTSGRDAGIAQMRRSFERLGVERMDLMQVHNLVDVETHLETLAEWKRDGRVRYVGITHYVESAFAEIERLMASHRLDFAQFNYSIVDRDAERRLLPAAAARGVAVIVNQPFASGALFDRVRGKAVPAWAAEIGCATWAQFFLKFILGHPAVTCVIPATAKARHLEDNLGAGRGALPDEAMRRRMAAYFDAI